MKNVYLESWAHVKDRFLAWWRHMPIGYPLMRIVATGKQPALLTPAVDYSSYEDMYTNAEKIVTNYRHFCQTHWFLEDAFPSVSLDLGPGKTAKVQCDFCALISPQQFREFIQPGLRLQCQRLDNSVYHLDGPDAVKHVPALMEISELDALQWTCGAGQPDGGSERWYPIYDQVREAGKSLWVHFYDGTDKDWVAGAIRLIQRYGPDCFYFIFPDFAKKENAMAAAAAIKEASKLNRKQSK